MRLLRLVPLAAVAVLAAACSSGSGAPSWTFGPASVPATSGVAAASAVPAPSEAPMSQAPLVSDAPAMSAAPAMTEGPAMSETPTMSDMPPASTDASALRVEVTLSDMMKIEPAAMTVPAGTPVTFVVTNTGTVLHEFTLGDEADQIAHDKEMAEAGGMSMPKDEPNAIGVMPGTTKELTYTFEAPGTTLAGCHVIGHYAAGMKATITIE